MKKEYVVELEPGVWVCKVSGDPGRTIQLENAQRFKTVPAGKRALKYARSYRPFKNGRVVPVQVSVSYLTGEGNG